MGNFIIVHFWDIAIGFPLGLFVAWRAGQMGYSRVLWFIASWLSALSSLYMIVFIALLAALPNRSLDEKRKRERELLEQQLLLSGISNKARFTIVPRQTISNEETIR